MLLVSLITTQLLFDNILCDKPISSDDSAFHISENDKKARQMLRDGEAVPYCEMEEKPCNLTGYIVGFKNIPVVKLLTIEEDFNGRTYPDVEARTQPCYIVAYGMNCTSKIPVYALERETEDAKESNR